jgi:hypothetical protein
MIDMNLAGSWPSCCSNSRICGSKQCSWLHATHSASTRGASSVTASRSAAQVACVCMYTSHQSRVNRVDQQSKHCSQFTFHSQSGAQICKVGPAEERCLWVFSSASAQKQTMHLPRIVASQRRYPPPCVAPPLVIPTSAARSGRRGPSEIALRAHCGVRGGFCS